MSLKLLLIAASCAMVCVAQLLFAQEGSKTVAESPASLASKLDQLELMWKPGQASAYFARAKEIAESLPHQPAGLAQPAGVRLLSALLKKKPASEKDVLAVGATDLRVMAMLGGFLSAPAIVPIELEQEKVRLLATLLGRLRSERIPDYVWQEVTLNVAPPAEVRGVSGMNPDEIKDPVLREQYKAARRENRVKALQNMREKELSEDEFLVGRRIVEYLGRAARSDSAVANTVTESVPRARLTDSEKKEVLEQRAD
jgi:hypothetical protein